MILNGQFIGGGRDRESIKVNKEVREIIQDEWIHLNSFDQFRM